MKPVISRAFGGITSDRQDTPLSFAKPDEPDTSPDIERTRYYSALYNHEQRIQVLEDLLLRALTEADCSKDLRKAIEFQLQVKK